jgi:hypothetical protein
MEANEAQELQEHAEHAEHDRMMLPVALTMTVLAVLVAVVTEAIITQDKATDQWNYYQAHKIRSNDTALTADLLSVLTIADKEAAKKISKGYADHQEKWAENLKEEQEQAEALEAKVEKAEARADHYDLGEALLEIGLVITSITLLTHKRMYWFIGMSFSVVGIVAAVLGVLLK